MSGGVGPSSRAGSDHARAAAAGAGNQIGDAGAAALAEGVKASGTLTELHLEGECGRGRGTELAGSVHARAAAAGAVNQIGDVGAAALAESAQASGALAELRPGRECGLGRGTELACGQC